MAIVDEKTNTWRRVKLGEAVDIIDGDRGKNYPKKEEFLSNGYCVFLDAKNVSGTKFYFSNVQFITKEKHNLMRKGQLQRNDFVLTTRGTVGNIAYYDTDIPYECMRINSGMVILRPKRGVVTDGFFYSFLISNEFKEQVESLKTGSAQPQLPIRDLKLFEVLLPPLIDQKRIADILSAFDDKIELNNKISAALEQMAQAIFKEWFVNFRFPGHEKVKMVDSELGKIPKGWEVKKLGDIADITIGRTPPREQQQWFTKSKQGKKWISIKDMGNSGIYIFDTEEKLTNEAVAKFNIPNIPANTVTVSFKLTIGRVSITTEEMASNEAIAHLSLKPSTALFPEYLYLFMKGVNLANFGSTSSIGTAVNSKTVKKVPILVPDSLVLDNSKTILESIFADIRSKILENQKLAALRDLLLPKLMSGTVRVKF